MLSSLSCNGQMNIGEERRYSVAYSCIYNYVYSSVLYVVRIYIMEIIVDKITIDIRVLCLTGCEYCVSKRVHKTPYNHRYYVTIYDIIAFQLDHCQGQRHHINCLGIGGTIYDNITYVVKKWLIYSRT